MHIPKDKMTSKERMTAFAKGEPLDRIPCHPGVGVNLAPLYGYTGREYNTSAKAMVDVICRTFREFGQDGVGIGIGPQGMPEALGAKVVIPEMGAPAVVKPAITDYAALDDMEPPDPYKDGRLPMFLEALADLKSKLGDEVPVGAAFSGPLGAAMLICGPERVLRDMRRKPEIVHKALELTTASLMRYMDAAVAVGVGVSTSEALASCSMIRPEDFETFAKPYFKRLADHLRDKHNRTMGIHFCGRSKPIWEHAADAGIVSLSIDDIEDLGEARKLVGHRMSISGNVSPLATMLNGSVADVYREVELCIKKGQGSPRGYMLDSCEIPVNTPRENIHAMMDAARIYGQYEKLALSAI